MIRIDTPVTASAATLDRTLRTALPVILVLYHRALPPDLENAMKTTAKDAAERLLVVKVDLAENPPLSGRYHQGIMAFREGKEIARTSDMSAAALQSYADYLLGKTSELKKETPPKTGGKPIVVTDRTFGEQVLKSSQPVLVDFWATWCAPCRMVAPTLEKLAGEFAGKATIAKLDVDQNPQTANLFHVRSIPTLILFKNGQIVDRAVGALPEPALRKLIQKHL